IEPLNAVMRSATRFSRLCLRCRACSSSAGLMSGVGGALEVRSRKLMSCGGGGLSGMVVVRWDDQDRARGVLGDLMRDAAFQALAQTRQATRADDDDRSADLVREIDDPFPGRHREVGVRFGVEARPPSQFGALLGALARAGGIR